MNNLEQVRAKIVEAVPELRFGDPCPCNKDKEIHRIPSAITLADVLRAIDAIEDQHTLYAILADGEFWCIGQPRGYGIGVSWNLALPLDEQSPEVIEFLHKILCV